METVIFDMDGTLVDVNPVRHYVRGESRNFDKFHRSSLFCGPNEMALSILRHPSISAMARVIVTARDARYEQVTRDWLTKYGITFDALYMRPWGDQRRDSVVKREILAQMRGDGYNPTLAVDDNPAVIEVWESEGIRTITIPGFSD
jgi:beta-phosphoglucomutase-like phosphatase (HAD superfamily)